MGGDLGKWRLAGRSSVLCCCSAAGVAAAAAAAARQRHRRAQAAEAVRRGVLLEFTTENQLQLSRKKCRSHILDIQDMSQIHIDI
jgi:hypothetical protein